MKEKISRQVLLAPFIFMILMLISVVISNTFYNAYEYRENRSFGMELLKEISEQSNPKQYLETALSKQSEYQSKNRDIRTLYSTSIAFLVIILTSLFLYGVFRYFIRKTEGYQKTLFIEKENLEKVQEELQYVNQQLSYQLYIDSLTQLENRFALERDIALMKEPKIILLDIDSFKDINEYYGSLGGTTSYKTLLQRSRDLEKSIKVKHTVAVQMSLHFWKIPSISTLSGTKNWQSN